MNIAANIMADASTFARTCARLGYDKSNIERGIRDSFSLTTEQAAEIATKAIAENTTDQEVHDGN